MQIAINNLEANVAQPAPLSSNRGNPSSPNINIQFTNAFIRLARIAIIIAGFMIEKPSMNCLYV